MGLFGLFKKKEWDEEKSNANKARMKELFASVVEDAAGYDLVYGFGLNIENSSYILTRRTTYEYTSLVVGYRRSDMSVVLIQTTPELEGCSEPQYFKRQDIKKAKIAVGQYTIYHQGGLMAGYTQFSVIPDNDEKYLVYCHQEEESEKFEVFWKEYCQKY